MFEVWPPGRFGLPNDPWRETTIYSFKGGNDGEYPGEGLLIDSNGNLYGTTAYGGGPCPNTKFTVGCGTVFKLSPPAAGGEAWKEVILHSFQAGADGYFPSSVLVADKQGNLYGATYNGGASSSGTVFEVFNFVAGHFSPPEGPWPEIVLYSFGGATGGGAYPTPTALIFNRLDASLLYGATQGGGASDSGTVFSLYGAPAWNSPPLLRGHYVVPAGQSMPSTKPFKQECLFVPVGPQSPPAAQ